MLESTADNWFQTAYQLNQYFCPDKQSMSEKKNRGVRRSVLASSNEKIQEVNKSRKVWMLNQFSFVAKKIHFNTTKRGRFAEREIGNTVEKRFTI